MVGTVVTPGHIVSVIRVNKLSRRKGEGWCGAFCLIVICTWSSSLRFSPQHVFD